MKALDSKTLQRFLKLAAERLRGGWALIGGTVLPALNVDHRATTDIDVVGLDNPTQADTLKLMQLAEDLGLPIESINQAGAHFLLKIPQYSRHLVPLRKGKSATIYRPDAWLYCRLKISRFSESDLADCVEYLKLLSRLKEPWDAAELRKLVLSEAKKAASSEEKTKRFERLLQAISG